MSFAVHEDLRPKAARWARALRRQIRRVWLAQAEDDPEGLAVELALAVAAVRVLDLEVFYSTHAERYNRFRDADPDGMVVNGMTLVRNAEIHLPIVVNPASAPVHGFRLEPDGVTKDHVLQRAVRDGSRLGWAPQCREPGPRGYRRRDSHFRFAAPMSASKQMSRSTRSRRLAALAV